MILSKKKKNKTIILLSQLERVWNMILRKVWEGDQGEAVL